MYSKAWLHACMRFFYRKNGRNLILFALDCKVATTSTTSQMRPYVKGTRSKVDYFRHSWLRLNGEEKQNNWRHWRRGVIRKRERYATSVTLEECAPLTVRRRGTAI